MLLLLLSCRGLARIEASDAPMRAYDVQFGDTLTRIAWEHGVEGGWAELAAVNRIRNPDYILAGAKLRVPTIDDRLPLWPDFRPAERFVACDGETLSPGRPAAGCDTCYDLGAAYSACACGDRWGLYRGGTPIWTAVPEPRATWWYDPDTAPEPPGALVASRHELDGDPAKETVVAWQREVNDLGMSRWEVAVFDGPVSNLPPVTFEAANWGEGSVVEGRQGCELLATEWAMGDEPGLDSDGWYLVGRRARLVRGALEGVASPVVARRLLDSFHPGSRRVGDTRVGTPAADLAKARSRSTDPGVELPVVAWEDGRVQAARRTPEGALELTIATRAGTVVERVDPDEGAVRRLGDLAAGTLFPPAYAPADLSRLAGRSVRVARYQRGWYEDPWAVVWLTEG
ncbi:MAG: LysM peptidoglycan-binding domain-containing protein [Myxococcota bacterium]